VTSKRQPYRSHPWRYSFQGCSLQFYAVKSNSPISQDCIPVRQPADMLSEQRIAANILLAVHHSANLVSLLETSSNNRGADQKEFSSQTLYPRRHVSSSALLDPSFITSEFLPQSGGDHIADIFASCRVNRIEWDITFPAHRAYTIHWTPLCGSAGFRIVVVNSLFLSWAAGECYSATLDLALTKRIFF